MKYLFNIIYSVCVVLMAYFCVDMTYKLAVPQSSPAIGMQEKETVRITRDFQKPPPNNPVTSRVITTRNLFKVDIESNGSNSKAGASVEKDTEKLEPTNLSLVLYGTVVGPEETYAVIEDKKNRKQDLYNVGDKVQGAQIKQILRHKVILLFQGKRQVLVMEEKSSKPSKTITAPGINRKLPTPAVLPSIKDLDPDQLPKMASNLMRQIKFRQHMKDGEPDGLMVYGIRPSSIFRKVGLRNGDIIQQVNGTPVLSESDAVGLLGELMQAEEAKLTLLRRGRVQEVVYSIPDALQGNE